MPGDSDSARLTNGGGTIGYMRTLGSWDGEGGPAWSVDFKDIDEELRYLRRIVANYRGNPVTRNQAIAIITAAGAPQRDKKAQAVAIGQWVQDNVYYVHELPERFQLPGETLRLKAGDCDDVTVLVDSLIESIGIPSALVCMRIDGAWSHIFPAAWITPAAGGAIALASKQPALLPLDPTMRVPVTDMQSPIRWAEERGKKVTLKIV